MNSQYCFMDYNKIHRNSLNRMDMAYIHENQVISNMLSEEHTIINMKKVIIDFQKGKTPKKNELVEEGLFPFVAVENTNNSIVNKDSINAYTNTIFKNLPIATKGEILIVVDGSGIGRTVVYNVNIPCHYIESLAKLTLNEEIIDKDYFVLFTKSNIFKKEVKGFGTFLAVPHLPQENMKRMVIPLLPLSEQQRTLPIVKEKIRILEDRIKELEKEKENNSLQNVIDRVFEEELGVKKPNKLINRYGSFGDSSVIIYSPFSDFGNFDIISNSEFEMIQSLQNKYECKKLKKIVDYFLGGRGYAKKVEEKTDYYRIMPKDMSSKDGVLDVNKLDCMSLQNYNEMIDTKIEKGDIL